MFLFLLIWDEKRYMLNVGKITANIGKNAKGIAKKAVAGAQGTLAGAAGASLPKVTGDIYQDGLNQTMFHRSLQESGLPPERSVSVK